MITDHAHENDLNDNNVLYLVCKQLLVGDSPKKVTKTISNFDDEYRCPSRVDKTKWLEWSTYSDWFTVTQPGGGKVVVTRSDKGNDGRWGLQLSFYCCKKGDNFLFYL